MSRKEAFEQYAYAVRCGQKYLKQCQQREEDPYPQVLDHILDPKQVAGQYDVGLVQIPAERIVGTRSEGRVSSFAGNFMPLIQDASEFSSKWISLCEAHLGDEGIRDPIRCYEYMGYFYVEEGNKRVSVLRSYDAPTIPGFVTRIMPKYTDDPAVRAYYEFTDFYQRSGLYSILYHRPGCYARLQAGLGFEPDHVWTNGERLRFNSAFTYFSRAYDAVNDGQLSLDAGEALLCWLKVFSLDEIRDHSGAELEKMLLALWPDIKHMENEVDIAVSTDPADRESGILNKLLSVTRPDHINAAFIYAFDPEKSAWTRSHVHGQEYVDKALSAKVSTKAYWAMDRDYDGALQQAVEDKAQVIFATTPQMLGACRKMAALHPEVHLLNCSLSVPYTGVRSYYSRIYESKFITGAVAGSMAEQDLIGYIADYPILGVPASINAFALGARLTNPRARIKLLWSCTDTDPLRSLIDSGVTVISNRDATNTNNPHWALEWGTYKLQANGSLLPLAVPCWDWGRFYEKVLLSIFDGSWNNVVARDGEKPVNYWWGLSSGVTDVQLSSALPTGTRRMAEILRQSIISGKLLPFRGRIIDQEGVVRNEADRSMSPEEIIHMDWLCDAVDGRIPHYDELQPMAVDTVRSLGIFRDEIPPSKEDARP